MNLASSKLRKAYVIFLACSLLLIPHASFAAEMLHMELWEEDNQYHLRSASIINAPAELIIHTLLDYNNFYRLSGGIKETRYLDPDPDGVPVALTVVESCVLFFCRQVKKTERVLLPSANEIVLEADPARSDFKFMHSRWLVKRQGSSTILSYDMDMQADFWIPPLIGSWAIKRKLFNSAMTMAHRMEMMAVSGTPLNQFIIQ
ncbi:MAG: hypothetical protein QNL05_06380 [Gammaproteobacteria bacterium]|nr:hypothetical protein [Gammaproteobacteria bacterium]MDX2487216.1 hypothetical protein [Gammaproteobacteria bacterium]